MRHIIIYLIIANISLYSAAIIDHDQISALLSSLKSCRSTENLKDLKDINAVLFIGSSASGKTTLFNTLKVTLSYNPNVFFPRRYITRPLRISDELEMEENIHTTKEEFATKISSNEIELHWAREMEEGRKELYGFEKVLGSVISIFSGNNAILDSEYVRQNRNLLIIGITAPDEVRQLRLAQRSPEISSKEHDYRIKDPYRNALQTAHILLDNSGHFEAFTSKFDIVTLIRALPLIKTGWGRIQDLGGHAIEYGTRLFNVMTHKVQFSDGIKKTFQYVRRSPGVRILTISGNKMLITCEWRTEANSWDFRLPGGKVFDKISEYDQFLSSQAETLSAASTAKRESIEEFGKKIAAKELSEECGIVVNPVSLRHVYTSRCGATVEWDLLYYEAQHQYDHSALSHLSHEGERVIMQWLNFDTVLDLCLKGVIGEDRTAALLMRYILNQKS